MAKKEKFARMVKEQMVDEMLSTFKDHPNFIITSFMGSSNSDLEQVRKNLRPLSSKYMVVKNALLKVAIDDMKLPAAQPMVEGGTGVAFAGEDIVAACKVLVTFAKDHTSFKIKGGVVDGKVVAADRVKALAALPPKEVLLAQVVGGFKAPITGFVLTLGGIIRKFVYAIDAIKVNKSKAS